MDYKKLKHCSKVDNNYFDFKIEVVIIHLTTMFQLLVVHCYEVTLIKKNNKPLLQKSKTKIFNQKRFHKKLVQSQREKKLGCFEIKSDYV